MPQVTTDTQWYADFKTFVALVLTDTDSVIANTSALFIMQSNDQKSGESVQEEKADAYKRRPTTIAKIVHDFSE